MFDDKPVNNLGQIPSNLPLGEPDDMFAGTEQPATGAPETSEPAVSLPPTALEVGILKPKVSEPVAPPLPNREIPTAMYPAGAPVVNGDLHNADMMKEPFGGRKVVTLVVTLMVIVIIGGGSAWVYFSFIRKPQTTPFTASEPTPIIPATPVSAPVPSVPTPVQPTNANGTSGGATTSIDNRILFGESNLDTDGDGITDDEERKLGTNYLKWDTDGDGLSDSDEVNTWKTNPLNVDTDGDTYPDGQEIKNGYNPKGTGKLFNPGMVSSTIPTTSTK